MKNKVLRVVSCVVFAVLLIGTVHVCAEVLEQKEAKKQYQPFFESETNFDVIYFGTSHMWNHVLPMEMWKEYGISSYNWGYSNCTPAEEYYILQDVLKYTNPKVVVIDVYGMVEYNSNRNGKYKDSKIEQQHVQFDSFPIYSISKFRAARDVFATYEHNEDFIWNFIMYHNRWSDLGEGDFSYDVTTEKGARFFTGMGNATFEQIAEDEKIELKSVCYPYYLKMIEYCRDRGIQVLSVYLPFAAKEQQQRVANSMEDAVAQYSNCRYVNMLTEGILDFNTDVSQDDHHLNYSGAAKVTSWLGRYLKNHYQLDDYSQDASWIEDYQAYIQHKKDSLLEQTTLPARLVQLADSDFISQVEIYSEDLWNSERLMALCENAGIVPTFAETETGACARLTVYDAKTKELVTDNYYMAGSNASRDLNKIVLKTGWQKVGENWYYYSEDGLMQTGMQTIEGETYFFEKSGEMFTGWRKIDDNWYFFEMYEDPVGVMRIGWRQIGGIWYYLKEDGVMATGFQEIDGEWYYFNEDGARKKGWIDDNGQRYWFDRDGIMARDTKVKIDGVPYTFNADGVCIAP